MKIRWSEKARLDLIEIGDYIARDNPSVALDWIIALERKAEQAARHPLSGRVVPELGRGDVREIFLNSYRFVYQVFDDHIEIVQLIEGHRLLREKETRAKAPKSRPRRR